MGGFFSTSLTMQLIGKLSHPLTTTITKAQLGIMDIPKYP